MSLTDFIFNGQAAPNTAATGGSYNVPQYLSDSNMNIANFANSYFPNAQPFTPPAPMVAGADPMQTKSWNMADQYANKYQPNVEGALSRAGGVAPTADAAYGTASNTVTGGLGRFTGQTVNDYMNPYIDNVTNRSSQLALRNWNENMLPGLNSMFVGAGQPLSSPNAAVAYRGGRDVIQNIQDDANATYAGAYDAGRNAFLDDQGRQITGGQALAGIAGNRAATDISANDAQARIAGGAQDMALRGAGALDAAGQEKAGIAQKNYDAANKLAYDQYNFPKTQMQDWAGTLGMLPGGGGTQNYVSPGLQYPSVAGSAVGNTAGLAGIFNSARGGLARGRPPIPAWLQEALAEHEMA